jgi:hypothetical protein
MKVTHVILCGFAFAAGVHYSTNVEAACVNNELDMEAQVQIGESWNQIVGPGESQCREGQGGLVSAYVASEPSPEMENLEAEASGAPSATGEVSPDGTVKFEKGDVDNYMVIYDGSGNEVDRRIIAGTQEAQE